MFEVEEDDGPGDETKARAGTGTGRMVCRVLKSLRREGGPGWQASGHLGEKSGLPPAATRGNRMGRRPWVPEERGFDTERGLWVCWHSVVLALWVRETEPLYLRAALGGLCSQGRRWRKAP